MKDGSEKICNLTVVDHQQTGTRYFIGTLIPPSETDTDSGESGENFRNFTIFDKMLQPTISINKEGVIEYVNDSVCKLTGYSKKEMLSRNVTMLMTAKRACVHDTYLQNYLKTGVKKVIGVGRGVDVKFKDGNVVRCILTVTEHFQGGVPFFMGTLGETTGTEECSSSIEGGSGAETDPYALFDNLLDATIVIGFDGIIAYSNNAAYEMIGYKQSELVGKNVNVLMPPLIARKHDGYLKAYAKSGIKHIIGKGREVPLITKNQQQVTVHLSVTEHEIGGSVQFIGTLTPHKAEFALYDTLLDCTIVINEQGIIQYANPAVKKLSGYRPSAIIGKNVKMMMPQEYAVKHDRYLKAYITTGKKKIIGTGRALPLLTRSATIISSHLSVVESRVGGQRVFVGTLRTKQDEEELQEMNLLNMTRNVLQDVANPCIVITKRGNIKIFNLAAELAIGYKFEDISGKNVKILMPESYAMGHDSYLKNYLKTGDSKIIGGGRIVPFVCADKTIKHFHLSLSVKKRDDKVVYFIGILSIVTTTDVLSPGVVTPESM
jgi:PAS domain S-box-containing protein